MSKHRLPKKVGKRNPRGGGDFFLLPFKTSVYYFILMDVWGGGGGGGKPEILGSQRGNIGQEKDPRSL